MNFKRLEKSVVYLRQRKGLGFRAGSFIITACHCLPRLPRNLYENVVVPIESFDRKLRTKSFVIMCDPVNDVAVLGPETVEGSPLSNPEQYEAFMDALISVRIKMNPQRTLSNWLPEPTKAHIFRHDRSWVTGEVKLLSYRQALIFVELPVGERIIGGTSGAPVFDDAGMAIGIVSRSMEGPKDVAEQAMVTHLAGSLPMSILGEIHPTRRIGFNPCSRLTGSGPLS